MKFITTFKSPNFSLRANNSEIKLIIIHYTAISSIDETIKLLCNSKSKLSSHFLISKKGEIFNLVDEEKRAWHAGKSLWKDIKDINSNSLGIELQNTGHHLNFENYPLSQINSLMRLISYLKSKFNISKKSILGHSDVAPKRKIDPGEKFPWKMLSDNNLSYLPSIKNNDSQWNHELSDISVFKKNLKFIGYDIMSDDSNENFSNVTKAFQMHFQQDFVKGYPNKKSLLLSEQYCKELVD